MSEKLSLITFSDFYMVPFCLLIIYFVATIVKRKYKGTILNKYFIVGLTVRLFFTVLYAFTIEYYYEGGDTTMFFQALHDMQNAVAENPKILNEIYTKAKLEPTDQLVSYFMYDRTGVTHYYMYQVSNYMVPRFALPFSFLFSKNYLCISFCLTFFAFAGCWRLFKLFYTFYPALHKKIAVATLFLPSLLFWGGALLKDSICIGAFGFFIHSVYQLFKERKNVLQNLVIIIFSSFLLFFIKPYIILCAVPALLIWMFFTINNQILDKGLRMTATVVFIFLAIGSSIYFLQQVAKSEIAAQYATQNIAKAIEAQQGTYSHAEGTGSYFTVGDFNNSIGSFLLLFPSGIVASLFRPFIWEVNTPIMLFTALESLAFLWLTVLCFRYLSFRKFRSILSNNTVLYFCLIYSVLFSGLVGMSTLNFGTLARYKIPALPLFLILLFVLLDKSGKADPKIILHKKLF